MMVDPQIDQTVLTRYLGRLATTIKEVCDPVEGDTYIVAGVPVSNFVLPSFFDSEPTPGVGLKYDFLGRLKAPMQIDPGGYMSFQQKDGSWSQIFGARAAAWRIVPPQGSRRERLRAGRHRWRRSTAI